MSVTLYAYVNIIETGGDHMLLYTVEIEEYLRSYRPVAKFEARGDAYEFMRQRGLAPDVRKIKIMKKKKIVEEILFRNKEVTT